MYIGKQNKKKYMKQQWKLTYRDSSIFTAMKTVAMLMVLIIHADLRDHGGAKTFATDFYNEFLSNILASAAVPIFFFILKSATYRV